MPFVPPPPPPPPPPPAPPCLTLPIPGSQSRSHRGPTPNSSTMNPNAGAVPPPRVPATNPQGGGDDKAPNFTFGTFSPEQVGNARVLCSRFPAVVCVSAIKHRRGASRRRPRLAISDRGRVASNRTKNETAAGSTRATILFFAPRRDESGDVFPASPTAQARRRTKRTVQRTIERSLRRLQSRQVVPLTCCFNSSALKIAGRPRAAHPNASRGPGRQTKRPARPEADRRSRRGATPKPETAGRAGNVPSRRRFDPWRRRPQP